MADEEKLKLDREKLELDREKLNFDRDKAAYDQNYSQFRSLNDHLLRLPTLAPINASKNLSEDGSLAAFGHAQLISPTARWGSLAMVRA